MAGGGVRGTGGGGVGSPEGERVPAQVVLTQGTGPETKEPSVHHPDCKRDNIPRPLPGQHRH